MPSRKDNTPIDEPLTKLGKERTMDETTYVDPVCGMEVTPETAAETVEYGAKTYYFCSPGCRTVFEMNPEKYTTPTRENPS